MRKRMKSENKNKGLIPGVKMILVCAVLFISLSAAGIFSYIKYKTDETGHYIPSVSSVRFENGRVLELTWSFGKYKKVQAGDYNYRLQFYDENRQLQMELNVGKISDTAVDLNSGEISDTAVPPNIGEKSDAAMALNSGEIGDMTVVQCSAAVYGDDGNEGTTEKYQTVLNFPIYIDSDDVIHLVLDAPDDRAAMLCLQPGADGEDFDSTYSAMKLWTKAGIDLTKKIYVRIQACDISGTGGKWAQSGYENLLMGQGCDSENHRYTISNSRHLFNIRFMEYLFRDKDTSVTYLQTESFSCDDKTFIPIESLSENSVYDGTGETIRKLILCASAEDEKLGFVRENRGTIKDLIIEEASVEGAGGCAASVTGVVCAVNLGVIENVRTVQCRVLGQDFVGGIAGCLGDGEMVDCENDGGTVSGRDFVGGIYGYACASDDEKSVFDGKGTKNRADVTGRRYVGGITGFNGHIRRAADTEGKDKTVYLPDFDACDDIEMIHWINEGLVYASEKYAGGITGYNTAVITDCEVIVETTDEALERLDAITGTDISAMGSYIGGVAGCSSGVIRALEEGGIVNVYCLVRGKNYVGGVVGCSRPSAKISGYKLSGGNITGQSFVGGYIGINHSPEILNGTVLEASPRLVKGQCFVGGLIGGNIVLVSDDQRSLTLNFNVHHEEGEVISAGPYAGGVAGFNALFTKLNESEAYGGSAADIILEKNEQMRILFDDAGKNSQKITKAMEELLYNRGSGGIGRRAGSGWQLQMTTPAVFLDSYGDMILAKVLGSVHVGGVCGYNDDRTVLKIKGIRNKADIYAEKTLGSSEGEFAYAGGIIGLVQKNCTVNQCTVYESVSVLHHGTYHGAVAEVNEGIITDCEGGEAGDVNISHLGGIVGLNREHGTVLKCRLTGTLSGNSNIGGIASKNKGRITECTIDGDVTGVGYNIGGAAGINEGVIQDTAVHKSVVGSGDSDGKYFRGNGCCVGGIAGYSTGSIENCTVESGGIRGSGFVGGFAGYQDKNYRQNTGGILTGLVNTTEVTAKNYAGGIVGYVGGEAELSQCSNQAIIYCSEGIVGGITAYNDESGQIKRCSVQSRLEAPNAKTAGGLCGINNGKIEQCRVDGGFKIVGSHIIGGIAGINNGYINLSTAAEVEIALQGGMPESAVGGIVGKNSGTIAVSGSPVKTSGKAAKPVIVTSNTGGSFVGGVAGYNEGVISGILPADVKTTMYGQIVMKNKAAAYIGGIAGKNEGEITGYIFSGYIEAFAGKNCSVGGIAGINGNNDEKDVQAVISQCETADIRLAGETMDDTGTGDTAKCTILVNGEGDTAIGGIAGSNMKNGLILESSLIQCYIRGMTGCTGGIAGLNQGEIASCKGNLQNHAAAVSKIRVKIYADGGSVGGIAGLNAEKGIIRECDTGTDWVILQAAQKEKEAEKSLNAAGGIAGRNSSSECIADSENYAPVKKTKPEDYGLTGGIVGLQETTLATGWRIENCKNYGTGEGGKSTGAIVAQWRYTGGTVSACENYGDITSFDSKAGMVGSICHLGAGQKANIISCVNFGSVSAVSDAGGIVGSIGENKEHSQVVITGCSNAGSVLADDENLGGIVGNFDDSSSQVWMNKCVNYYRAQDDNYNGIARYCVNTKVMLCMNVASNLDGRGDNSFYSIGINRRLGLTNLNFSLGKRQSSSTNINLTDSVPLKMQFRGMDYAAFNKCIEDMLEGLKYDPNSPGNKKKSAKTYYDDLHEAVEAFLTGLEEKEYDETKNE